MSETDLSLAEVEATGSDVCPCWMPSGAEEDRRCGTCKWLENPQWTKHKKPRLVEQSYRCGFKIAAPEKLPSCSTFYVDWVWTWPTNGASCPCWEKRHA